MGKKMNAHQRTTFRTVTRTIVDKIERDEHTWEGRFDCIAGASQAIHKLAADRGFNPREAVEEFAGEAARQIIARLGTPPIGELYQALCYMGSRDPAHRDASRDWQREHQTDMAAFARKHPEAVDDADGGYLLNLRQTILLITKADTPPAKAARRLIDRVCRNFKIGRLRLAQTAAPLGNTSNVEIFARWLLGELTPTDAATTVELQDEIERVERRAPELMPMLFAMRDRRHDGPHPAA